MVGWPGCQRQLSQLKPDAAAVKLLARAVGRGDDALLRVISDFLADAGIETVSPDDDTRPDELTADWEIVYDGWEVDSNMTMGSDSGCADDDGRTRGGDDEARTHEQQGRRPAEAHRGKGARASSAP